MDVISAQIVSTKSAEIITIVRCECAQDINKFAAWNT